MVDSRDGTRLTLARSQAGERGAIGDYAVPQGRYGVGKGELLRLECSTGKVLGIVPAGDRLRAAGEVPPGKIRVSSGPGARLAASEPLP